jgi:hypothetical protein
VEAPSVRSPSTPVFTDVAAAAGLDFVHTNGATGRWRIFEIVTSGGAFLDHDGDGDLDVFLTQGNDYDAPDPGVTSRLYRNDGGSFTDVTEGAGAGLAAYTMGASAADYDGDGDVDLYVTAVGPDALLRNDGSGVFSDVTAAAGLGDPGLGTSAVWFDYDRDGDLDLYVARYLEGYEAVERCHRAISDEPDYCAPLAYAPVSHLLYRNRGDGTFEDASAPAGITAARGYGLAVISSDFDGDGWLDLYVACDQSPALLWINRRDGTFVERGMAAGAALSGNGEPIAGMGVVAEDFDSDLDLDLLVTNLIEERSLFLRNDDGLFLDVSTSWGEPGWLSARTGFGVVAFDQDHDARLDLFIGNGAVIRASDPPVPERPYDQPNSFVRQSADGRFRDATAEVGGAAMQPGLSRGVAVGDYDEDGDMDVLVCRTNSAPQLLRNEQSGKGHWLLVETVGPRGRGPVLNAVVTVEAGGRRQVREVRAQQSYLTTSDVRLHFGLGRAALAERVSVRWPDGRRESWNGIAADRKLVLRYGEGSSP